MRGIGEATEEIEVSEEDLLPRQEGEIQDVENLVTLQHVNEAILLEVLRLRFGMQKIYVSHSRLPKDQ